MDLEQAERAIAAATKRVFATMLDDDPDPGQAFRDETPLQGSEVTALIPFSGAIGGMLSLHCGRVTAAQIAAGLLDFDPEELSPSEVSDGLGEVANMVAGAVKLELDGFSPIEIAVPTVVIGDKPAIDIKARLAVVVPFSGRLGEFSVEFVVSSRS